jgi:transcriptional regulator with XRE-family HTH domain
MNAPLDFPGWFRYHRAERKLTQAAISDLAGVPVTLVQQLERNGAIPGFPVLLSLAEALDPDPPIAETLRRAGYSSRPAEPAVAIWRGLDRPSRLALAKLAEVPTARRGRCLHLVAAVVNAWLEAEGLA